MMSPLTGVALCRHRPLPVFILKSHGGSTGGSCIKARFGSEGMDRAATSFENIRKMAEVKISEVLGASWVKGLKAL